MIRRKLDGLNNLLEAAGEANKIDDNPDIFSKKDIKALSEEAQQYAKAYRAKMAQGLR
ncbi:MAG: hypothetical protein R3C68_17380 [Myxococcota bacterium]